MKKGGTLQPYSAKECSQDPDRRLDAPYYCKSSSPSSALWCVLLLSLPSFLFHLLTWLYQRNCLISILVLPVFLQLRLVYVAVLIFCRLVSTRYFEVHLYHFWYPLTSFNMDQYSEPQVRSGSLITVQRSIFFRTQFHLVQPQQRICCVGQLFYFACTPYSVSIIPHPTMFGVAFPKYLL